MAYQRQAGGPDPGAPGMAEHAPQGTDYTLQGVMRFLQVEWHTHERARNSWDIERAEMKAKIAKQEGELRQSRRMNDQLNRQIKMLELALRNERKRQGDKTNATRDTTSSGSISLPQAGSEPVEVKAHRPEGAEVRTSDHVDIDELAQPEVTAEDRDEYRDKSRKYLEKCMQEIQYLLAPPPHPPMPSAMPNGPLPGLPEPPPTLPEDRIPRARQFSAQGNSLPLREAANNHQANSYSRANDPMSGSISLNDPTYATPDTYDQELPVAHTQTNGQPLQIQLNRNEAQSNEASSSQVLPRTGRSQAPQQKVVEDTDGWNFDDTQVLNEHTGQEIQLPSRRPDTDAFPSISVVPARSPPRTGPHRRRSSGASSLGRRRSSGSQDTHDSGVDVNSRRDVTNFKVRFALRGHLDVVRSVIFTGGGSPSEPEVCTAGDDGMIKRWIIPAMYGNIPNNTTINDLDIASYFTHRGHEGIITCLASYPSTSFSTGGRATGDGWIFSGGEDATIRVWERGRVDPKATLDGHTDTIWSVCTLPGTCGNVFREQSARYGGADRLLLVSGSADGTVKVWAVNAPPPSSSSAAAASRRGVGGSRRHSVTSGSNHPSSPQPNTATSTPFHYTLIHNISRGPDSDASPTCICPLSPNGDNFAVSYSDSNVLIFDTRTGEQIIGMASNETYDGTIGTSINTIAATSSAPLGSEGSAPWAEDQEESVGAGPTGSAQGLEGVIVSGHEDRYIRFFDANSGQCTYTMLAHPSAISSLSLSHDGHEAVSAGHDASIRFWSLDKRICTQDITSHRPMRGEGVCSVVWSQDGRYVVSAGGDGVVKVFSR